MAGRFLPQRDVNLITRVTRELIGDKQNNKDGLINQEVVIYKPLPHTNNSPSVTSAKFVWLLLDEITEKNVIERRIKYFILSF